MRRHSPTLVEHLTFFRDQFHNHTDLVIREFFIPSLQVDAALLFIGGLANEDIIHDQILKPLMLHPPHEKITAENGHITNVVTIPHIQSSTDREQVAQEILAGNTSLLINHREEMFLFQTAEDLSRAIDVAMNESTVRGPKVSFVESLDQNIILLQQRIQSTNLMFKPYQIGHRSQKEVKIGYMQELADPKLVQEVETRLKNIDIDYVNDIGYIEQLIGDNYLSVFPLTQNTERPDRVSAALMEGRIAIFLDGSPSAILVPVTFSMFFQTPDDYYENWWFGSGIRLVRLLALFITTLLPSLYIALISYHPGLIPTKLIASLVTSREGIPFPAFFEALLMEITIELLREAGIRLPKTIGQAVGIVGGLVIGQAAVMAGIVSQIMVIIVSLTAIASFALPNYSTAISFRVLRFFFMIASSILGLYGILWLFIMVSIHLVRSKSFGIIYTSPISPLILSDWTDTLFRAPIHLMKKRPYSADAKQKKRMDDTG